MNLMVCHYKHSKILIRYVQYLLDFIIFGTMTRILTQILNQCTENNCTMIYQGQLVKCKYLHDDLESVLHYILISSPIYAQEILLTLE
jgi:hypothetical protein